jgi:hypothetical protein
MLVKVWIVVFGVVMLCSHELVTNILKEHSSETLVAAYNTTRC